MNYYIIQLEIHLQISPDYQAFEHLAKTFRVLRYSKGTHQNHWSKSSVEEESIKKLKI